MPARALQDRIADVFIQHLQIQPPSPDTDLMNAGIIDSLTFVELIARLEQEFSIRIPLGDLDLDDFRSIARIGEFIRQKLPDSEARVESYSRV
jgi:methoxymalonate biosynthesis acyl carrier protein